VRNVHPREKNELILTLKVEPRHPIERQFGSKFSAMRNHNVVMMA